MARFDRLGFLAAFALFLSTIGALSPALVLAQGAPDDPGVIGPGGAPPAGSGPVDVEGFVRGIDGDTMETWIAGSRVGLGLIGVDAPEGNTVCGELATGMLQGMLYAGIHLEEEAEIVFDGRLRRMYYGYTPDGQPIANALVEAGVALASGEGHDAAELQALEEAARQAGAGCLWGSDTNASSGPVDTAPAASTERGLLALPSEFQAQAAVSGLNFPTDFAFLPDGRILIAEKDGVVRIAVNGNLLGAPFIDLSSQVNDYWDRGLLSVAVDPDFASNGFVYFLYTYEHNAADYSGTKTGRLIRVTASGNTASLASAVTVLGSVVGDSCDDFATGADCIPSDGPSHSTGGMRFAADGTLYATLGEGANFNAATPQALRAQSLDSLGGKLVRITTSGQGVPGNPFWTGSRNDVRSKIWATGFRNAYRFSLNPDNGVPYVGDVGWVSWEEVNVAASGTNLGWPCYEGIFQQAAYSSYAACQQLYSAGTATPPIITWDHTTGGSAVTGGVFYTGSSYPAEYQDAYFYGDYARNFIRYAQMTAGNQVANGPFDFDTSSGGPVDFEMGPEGDLYYLSINSGEVRRIVYQGTGGGSQSGFVSDMAWESFTNGWGPAERDLSNGEQAAGDGGPLTINGAVFAKGVGMHSPSEIVIALDGACSQFISSVGIDDEVGDNGSVEFEVYSGSTLLASSGTVTGTDGPETLNANLAGVTDLRLVVSDAGDNDWFDHADWADAWIECGQDQTPPTVTTTNPADGASGVAVSANISATFSEGIDEASLAGNISLLEDGSTPVAVTVSYDPGSSVVTIDPDSNLALDTSYTVTIDGGSGGVTDLAGNPLAADETWSFTTADSTGPLPVITSPLPGDTFIVGDEISYGGSATDALGIELPVSALTWRVVIFHCNHIDCHEHQVLEESGVAGGSFPVPDHGDQYYFEITLTAASGGLENSTSVEIHPETVDVTLQSIPAGLNVNLAGEEAAAPLTRPIVVGSVITVSAPSPQGEHVFDSWSDGGARVHSVAVGTSDITLTATYSGGGTGGETYLSDMVWASASNHWGPVERDLSNGEQAAGDGGPLTIGGVSFAKGLGAHAPSTVNINLDGCSLFQASIGVDDEVGGNGSVIFQVRGDGATLYQSGVLRGTDAAAQNVAVDIAGVDQLELVVTDAGDNVYWDHADWADARVTCGGTSGDTTPPGVISTNPADEASGVPLTATVSATFSEAIDESTLTGNMTLSLQGGGAVPGTLSYNAATRTATLAPSSQLAPEATYVATVQDGVTDLAGNALPGDVSWEFTTAPDATGGGEIYISDMSWVSQRNGFGPIERDESNGEDAAGDGGPLTINGSVYGKGIGTHANAEIVVALDGSCTTFSAIVGIDDEVGSNGSVAFEVWGDGVRRAMVSGLTGTAPGFTLTADISGVSVLRLAVTDGGDNVYWDHADWAEAKVVCGGPPPQDTTPPAVTAITPANGANGVPLTASATATFSEDLDTDSLPGNVELRVQGAPGLTLIQANYSTATDVLTVTPAEGFEPTTTYVLTIMGGPGGVTDLAGNPLAADEVWSFTTGAGGSTGDEIYISDLSWVSSSNHWGPVERDESNGEQGAGDGQPLTIGGSVYGKGIGTHAPAEVVIALDGTCSTFAAMVGIDEEVGDEGSVAFQVFADGALLHTSPVLRGSGGPHSISVDISGRNQLRLVVTDGGDNADYDHADWGDARLICDGGGQGDTTPPTVTATSPAAGATGVDVDTTVTAAFSEAIEPTSILSAVTLSEQGGGVVPAQLSYNSSTLTLTLTMPVPLDEDTSYEVRIRGGATGVKDMAGNPMAADEIWTFSTSGSATIPLFEAPSKIAAGTNAHGVSVADVDSDGNLDLVVATTGADAVVILLGDGDGGFATSGSYPTGIHPKFATTGDFNGDGRIDFASANQDDTSGNDVSVYLGNGDGTFTSAGGFAACANPHEVKAGDLDEDGNQDLVVPCWGGSVVSVLFGNGDGTFEEAVDLGVGSAPHSAVVVDLNDDGDLDIATADHGSNSISILLGNGDGTFAPRQSRSVGSGPHSLRGGDIDRDGTPDLVTANDAGDSVSVLLGNGNGTFSREDFTVGDEPKGVALGDVDGDGWLDIVSANIHGTYPCCSGETSISVLFNDQSGGFASREDFAVTSSPFSVATGDFNGDGKLDVASANWHTNDVAIFLNNR